MYGDQSGEFVCGSWGCKGLRVDAIKVKTTGTFLSNLARAILRVAAKLDLPTPTKKLM